MRIDSSLGPHSSGTFRHTANSSFYGTAILPPLELEVGYEMHRGRPVFRYAVDQRGVTHEIELLNQAELRESYQREVRSEDEVVIAAS